MIINIKTNMIQIEKSLLVYRKTFSYFNNWSSELFGPKSKVFIVNDYP